MATILMKILYKHLVNRINNEPKICELSEKLFQLGHEHEIEDHIFDMEFTPNRGDCLSLKGLLRDLNLFYETNPVMEVYEKDINNFKFKFTNNANYILPFYLDNFLRMVIHNHRAICEQI